MDRRFLTVLGVSLLFALVISSVFYQMTRARAAQKKAEQADQRDIVVAAKPMAVGVHRKADRHQDRKDSRRGVSERSVLEAGRSDRSPGHQQHPDGRTDSRRPAGGARQRTGLAPIIPVGMRAVTVRVNDVAGVAGFVLPGMRVDVLVTGRPPDANGTITATCLQNILVLSAGTTMQADARGQAIQAPTVTLLVSPDQAETLRWPTTKDISNWYCGTAATKPSKRLRAANWTNCTAS